jgi:hypothetical protein
VKGAARWRVRPSGRSVPSSAGSATRGALLRAVRGNAAALFPDVSEFRFSFSKHTFAAEVSSFSKRDRRRIRHPVVDRQLVTPVFPARFLSQSRRTSKNSCVTASPPPPHARFSSATLFKCVPFSSFPSACLRVSGARSRARVPAEGFRSLLLITRGRSALLTRIPAETSPILRRAVSGLRKRNT